jgi:hypothetical protein
MLLEYFGLNLDNTEAQAVMSSFTQVLHQQCDTQAPDEGPEPVWLSSAQSRALAALRDAAVSRRQGLTPVPARPGAPKPMQDNAEMMQTLYATETSMATPLSGSGELYDFSIFRYILVWSVLKFFQLKLGRQSTREQLIPSENRRLSGDWAWYVWLEQLG